jgi:hypothetical protein
MFQLGFELAIAAGERLQIHALDRAVIGIMATKRHTHIFCAFINLWTSSKQSEYQC